MKDRGRKGTEGGFFWQSGLSPVWVTEDGLSEFPGRVPGIGHSGFLVKILELTVMLIAKNV